MNPISMDSLLAKLNAAREAASRLPVAATAATKPASIQGSTPIAKASDFASLLASSVGRVDEAQKAATTMAEQFQLGAPNVNLEDAMVSLQKANISFQAMVQVRNKVVAAYNEIMNMQI